MSKTMKSFHNKSLEAYQVIEKLSQGSKTQIKQAVVLAQFYDFAHEQAQKIEYLESQVKFLEALNADYVGQMLESSNEEEKVLIKKLYKESTNPETKKLLKEWADLVVQGLRISNEIKNR